MSFSLFVWLMALAVRSEDSLLRAASGFVRVGYLSYVDACMYSNLS